MLRFIVRQALKLLKYQDGDRVEPHMDASGRMHVTSGPALAHEPVDLSSVDATWAAGQEPRAVWANGAGDVKVDGFKRDGTAVTGTVFTLGAPGLLPVGQVTKVWKTGTTVSVVALW